MLGAIKRISAGIIFLSVLSACGGQGGEDVLVGPQTGHDDRLLIAGSSTLAPFITTAAEYFGATSDFATPVVETTGTGGGFKLFCRGTELTTTSIATASRRITDSERAFCAENGVTDVYEMIFGYDGIVIITSINGQSVSFSHSDLYRALAKDLYIDGKLAPNPYKRWSEVNPALPDIDIEVFGPPPTSGTRDAFVELVLERGAMEQPALAALKDTDPEAFDQYAHTIRTDGAWTDSGENDTQIIQSLIRNNKAFGVVGFSYLDQSGDRVKAASVDGVEPTFDSIVSNEYMVSRSLYLYVKMDHLTRVMALRPFLEATFSNNAMGADGYLVEKGLIPLSAEERRKILGNFETKAVARLQ